MTRKPLIPLLTAALLLSGCAQARGILYLLSPATKKVKAACGDMEGKIVAIVVYCDRSVLYDYPDVPLSLSSAVAGQLTEHVKDIVVVDPRRVVRYQDDTLDWEAKPRSDLGKAFGADYLLFISLVQYSTREPGSLNLYRGRITAQAHVYKVSEKPVSDKEARIWQDNNVRVVYPEHDPTGLLRDSDRAIRVKTESIFADKLAKRFYDHEVPVE